MIMRMLAVLGCLGGFCGSAAAVYTPGNVESVGLTRIVADTTAGDIGAHYGQFLNDGSPYVSVLGNSVFLIYSGTFAEMNPQSWNRMRHAIAFHRVDGGPYGQGEVFFSDDGTPYRGEIGAFRPGRIAGDMRPGARYFLAAGEASPHLLPDYFGAMPPGPTYGPIAHYGCAQMYGLDPETLEQSMASEAIDVLQGVSGVPANAEDVSRFGGEAVALSNGNFLVVVDDQSKLLVPTAAAIPTAMIVKSNGIVVRPAFVLWPGAAGCRIWSNVAAYQGGFVVRYASCGGVIRFYDNDGNFRGEVLQDDPNLRDSLGNQLHFPTDRGDKARIAGHINSPYVYVAGCTTGHPGFDDRQVVTVAVWDARTMAYVAQCNVSELTPAHGGMGTDSEDLAANTNGDTPRVALAVDAMNRICVTSSRGRPSYVLEQLLARVLAFDPGTNTFSHLTNSFWVFINTCDSYGSTCAGIGSKTPSIGMTTRQICIAAQGRINLDNQPQNGPTSAINVNFYTIISHPDPQDDPTPPAVLPTDCPVVTSVQPGAVLRYQGLVEDVTVTGEHFVPGSTSVRLVAIGRPTLSIPASQVAVAADGKSLRFDLDVSGAAGGLRTVFVSVAGSDCPDGRLAGVFDIADCYTPAVDADGDGEVDQADFAVLQRCITGDGTGYKEGCACFDRDADADIDGDDIAAFVDCATGPGVSWEQALAPNCSP